MKHYIIIALVIAATVALGLSLDCVSRPAQADVPSDVAYIDIDATYSPMTEAILYFDQQSNRLTGDAYKMAITVDPELLSDDGIREIVQSGRICELYGHNWEYGRPSSGVYKIEDNGTWVQAYADTDTFRECKLCKLKQTRDLTWK